MLKLSKRFVLARARNSRMGVHFVTCCCCYEATALVCNKAHSISWWATWCHMVDLFVKYPSTASVAYRSHVGPACWHGFRRNLKVSYQRELDVDNRNGLCCVLLLLLLWFWFWLLLSLWLWWWLSRLLLWGNVTKCIRVPDELPGGASFMRFL